jgi:hypothetical protein
MPAGDMCFLKPLALETADETGVRYRWQTFIGPTCPFRDPRLVTQEGGGGGGGQRCAGAAVQVFLMANPMDDATTDAESSQDVAREWHLFGQVVGPQCLGTLLGAQQPFVCALGRSETVPRSSTQVLRFGNWGPHDNTETV